VKLVDENFSSGSKTRGNLSFEETAAFTQSSSKNNFIKDAIVNNGHQKIIL